MTLDEAYEYVSMAHEAEGEQRAEYGSGCVSMGYDPAEWGAAYEGYRTSEDPEYAEAQRIIAAAQYIAKAETGAEQELRRAVVDSVNNDDIPF